MSSSLDMDEVIEVKTHDGFKYKGLRKWFVLFFPHIFLADV